MNEKRIVKLWQAGLMLLVGIAVIIAGLLVMKLNNRIVLALDGYTAEPVADTLAVIFTMVMFGTQFRKALKKLEEA